jgi:hypothetical protein
MKRLIVFLVAAAASFISCAEPDSVSSPINGVTARDLQEPPPPCKDCILSPVVLTHPQEFVIEFKAIQGEYQLEIDSDDRPGGLLELELNGVPLTADGSGRKPISADLILGVRLGTINILKGRTLGRPDLRFVLEIPQPFPPGLCPQQRDFLVYPTTPPEMLASIVPLGNLSPPDHVIPTHHVYMVPLHSGEAGRLPVHAPYPGRVVALGRASDRGDYYLYLTVCEGIQLYFIHLTELSPRLAFLTAEPFGGYELGPGLFKLTRWMSHRMSYSDTRIIFMVRMISGLWIAIVRQTRSPIRRDIRFLQSSSPRIRRFRSS